MVIISARNLSKRFKDLVAVDGIDLEIESGECFGLLGPNGAGKTSLIRMITAVSPSTGGEIWVDGKDIRLCAREIKAVMGVVPQGDNLDEDLRVFQNLTTFARYFSIPRKEAHRRSLEVLRLFQLEEKRNSRIKELSGGMRRRLLIARGMINNPRIMVLDEPTIGLDPQARHLVWRKLGQLKGQGVTQLLCTQNMGEAMSLCDRVAIMHLGRVLALDTPRALIAQHIGEEVLEVAVTEENRPGVTGELSRQGFDFTDIGDAIEVYYHHEHQWPEGLADMPENRRRPATLEDVFFRLTGRTLTE